MQLALSIEWGIKISTAASKYGEILQLLRNLTAVDYRVGGNILLHPLVAHETTGLTHSLQDPPRLAD
jgi:hypothetical protein